MWICPICTLYSGKAMKLNDVPYRHGQPEDFKNQATDHVKGKRHERLRLKVANELFQGSGCANFFAIIGRSVPNSMQFSQAAALKEYTEECGGNGDKTISKLEPLPPPDPILKPMVVCKREIISPDYATKVLAPQHIMRTQLLCCWDDPRGTAQCTRGLCPYRHTRAKQETMPPEQQHNLYEIIPCNFAGMRGGCRLHKTRFKGKDWNVPVWQVEKSDNKNCKPLAAGAVEQNVLDARDETVEYLPVYDGNMWDLHQCCPCDPGATQMQREQITEEYVREITGLARRFLDGYDDSE